MQRSNSNVVGRVEDWRGNPLGEPLSVSGVSPFVPGVEYTVIPFPAPASSHAACGFPALRAPAHFTSKFMGPHELGVLSTTLIDRTRDRHQTTQAYRTANAYSTVSSQSPGAKAPRRFSLRLDVKLSPQILQTYRWFYHLTAASHVVESMMCSRAPLLDRHYPVSTLIRTQPPPSRLWPISRGNRLYGLPCSSHFCLGRGRLLQLLSMPLSPCYPYHPAGGARLNSQSATHPAAFASP